MAAVRGLVATRVTNPLVGNWWAEALAVVAVTAVAVVLAVVALVVVAVVVVAVVEVKGCNRQDQQHPVRRLLVHFPVHCLVHCTALVPHHPVDLLLLLPAVQGVHVAIIMLH